MRRIVYKKKSKAQVDVLSVEYYEFCATHIHPFSRNVPCLFRRGLFRVEADDTGTFMGMNSETRNFGGSGGVDGG